MTTVMLVLGCVAVGFSVYAQKYIPAPKVTSPPHHTHPTQRLHCAAGQSPLAVSCSPVPQPFVLGIDLGTTYSVVALYHGNSKEQPLGIVEVVADEHGRRCIPSVVAFTDDGPIVGLGAKAQVRTSFAQQCTAAPTAKRRRRSIQRHSTSDLTLPTGSTGAVKSGQHGVRCKAVHRAGLQCQPCQGDRSIPVQDCEPVSAALAGSLLAPCWLLLAPAGSPADVAQMPAAPAAEAAAAAEAAPAAAAAAAVSAMARLSTARTKPHSWSRAKAPRCVPTARAPIPVDCRASRHLPGVLPSLPTSRRPNLPPPQRLLSPPAALLLCRWKFLRPRSARWC